MNRFNALSDNTSSIRTSSSKKKGKKDKPTRSGSFNSFRQAKPTENTRFPKPSSSDSLSSIVSRSSTPSPKNENRFNNTRFKAFNDRRGDKNTRRNNSSMSSPRERQSNRNTFNWKKKEAEQKEQKRMKQIERSEENFPTLGGAPTPTTTTTTTRTTRTPRTSTTNSNNSNNQDANESQKVSNGPSYKSLFVYKKTKSRKVKANHIPNGWVKLKRVNGKIQKTYGKPIVRRQRNQHLTVATQKMFNGMWQTMEDSWSDGFWDCRQGQLEKILSDNLYNSDDDSLSDEEYYSDDNKEEEEETNTHLGRTKRS